MENLNTVEIIVQTIIRFWPTWAALFVTIGGGFFIRERMGVVGRLYGSPIGLAGAALVLFWVFTAVFAELIAPQAPLEQFAEMKKALPGSGFMKQLDDGSEVPFYYLWGGDNLARDLFSRVVFGSQIVLIIAPAATLIAYMVGSTLGLPAGYYLGWIDTFMSFLANLVLAFPVILLFYLLVTPEVNEVKPIPIGPINLPWSLPIGMAAFFFLFPIIFLCTLWYTKYEKNMSRLAVYMGITIVVGLWLYSGLVFNRDPLGMVGMAPNELNVFAAVILGSSPGVFRIVRGLTMDIKTRDYVAAAQTRGERPWYIMLWEILPNARGPLIVDFCLRIGYTTILLGTLGFFG
ncbi:MAG: ABC transporter permease, partial [Pseudomonadota bacterium]